MRSSDFYDGIQTAEQLARRSHRLLILVIAILGIAVASGAIYIFRQIEVQMEQHAAAASDNRTWVIAQLEVDLNKFILSLAEGLLAEEPTDQVETIREQFDILYSRVALLKNSDSLKDTGLQTLDEWIYLSGEDGLLNSLIPVIDGPDDDVVAAIPAMMNEMTGIRANLRIGVVEAVFMIMGRGDILRKDLRDTLRMFAGATLWLLTGMAVLMAGLFLQSRSRMKHARALEYALQNLRTTINSALDAVLIVNSDGRVVGSNCATVAMFGGKLETNRPSLEEILRETGEQSVPVGLAALVPGMRVRIQGMRLDGKLFPAEASVGTGRTIAGQAITVIFIRDISEQIAHEESLAQARNAAMEADEAKARFLAVMSHEMRTPLTGLLSALDLLVRTTPLDETQAWLSDIIRTCGTTALDQVNNVLHLSRMNNTEAGDYPASDFSIAKAVIDIARQFEPDAARSETSIELVGVEDKSLGVTLPLQLLQRALGNLLSNAVKFTERGHIRVKLTHSPAERQGWVSLRIAVQDTGIGIAEEDLDRIFRNFETLDSSFARVREGSGLGLGIAKLAVEEMDGTIETESVKGKGSCFTITLEAPIVEIAEITATPRQLPSAPLDGLSVLLAEDNAINRTLMTRQLEGLGATVTAAVDGQDAVEKATAIGFDIILMDVSMPRLDGLSATRLIRQSGASQDVPVIAVTAQAAPDRREQFFLAGMSDVLTKPARIDQLVEVILKYRQNDTNSAILDPGLAKTDDVAPIADAPHLAALVEDLGREFVARTVDTFRSETEKTFDLTRKALEEKDLGRVRALTHSSAGAAAALGLCALNKALLKQETAASEGDEQTVNHLQANVEHLYGQSLRYLAKTLANA